MNFNQYQKMKRLITTLSDRLLDQWPIFATYDK